MPNRRLDAFVSCTALAAILLCTAVVVRREFIKSAASDRATPLTVSEETWSAVSKIGREVGTHSATVKMIVFSDYQCPFCRTFALHTLPEVEKRFPGGISIRWRHWPLRPHPLAYPAARAAECAGDQGRFHDLHMLLFRKQDSIGQKTFRSYAEEAQVPDIAAFEVCIRDSTRSAVIDTDIEHAGSVGARGTPAVLVNGTFVRGTHNTEGLLKEIEAIMKRRRKPAG